MTPAEQAFEEARRRIAAWREGETLNLAIENLEEIPKEIGGLSDLETLVFSQSDWFEDLPSADISDLTPVSGLVRLRALDCSRTKVADLAPLAGISGLLGLACSSTHVTDLTPLAALRGLQAFYCSFTQVSDLAPIAGISGLQTLDCSSTQVSDLAPLAGVRDLHTLNCSSTSVFDLAPLAGLQNLKAVACTSTQVSDLAPLSGMSSLQTLYCAGTKVPDLTPLAGISGLQTLDCSGTPVSDLAPLAGISGLQTLNCWSTQVSDLASLAGISGLRALNCSFTQVSDLAPLAGISGLQTLDCSSTQVSDLTPLAGLQSLHTLDCSNLDIKVLPAELWFLETLKEALFFRATVPSIPTEVLSQSRTENCLPAVRAHLNDIDGGAEKLADAKLMIIGNGRVGKTQVAQRLHGAGFNPDIPSTHGIQVASVPMPTADQGQSRLHIWDFGGQDIYHGTHALFLRSRAIFMVAWTPHMETNGHHEHEGMVFRNHPAAYWVEYVRRFGSETSPVLLVQTQCDDPEDERLPPESIHAAIKGFAYKKILQYSAKNDRGRAALDEALAEAYGRIEKPLIGSGRAAVKRQIEALRDEDAARDPADRIHRTMSRADFDVLCEKAGRIGDTGQFLTFLHNAGTIFYRPGLFDGRLIIDQGWALEAIYAVFHRANCYPVLEQMGGRFTRSLLGRLLWDRDYGRDEQDLFIDMMRSCGICFTHRHGDESTGIDAEYAAPDLLPLSPPADLGAKWDTDAPTHSLAFRYPLLPPALMRGIIAAIGERAGVLADYWRTGLWAFETTTGARALIDQQMDGDWHGTIRVRTQGGQAAALLDRLAHLVREEEGRLGLESERTQGRPSADLLDEDKTPLPPMHFASPRTSEPTWFVSYERRDNQLSGIVDAFCERARSRGVTIRRDEDELKTGDSIARFIEALGRGDRIIIFMSDAYLKSPFCMAELLEIWRNARQEPDAFCARVCVHVADGTQVWEPEDRFDRAMHWLERQRSFRDKVHTSDGWSALGEHDTTALRNMDRFAHNVSDMLAVITDRIQALTLDELERYAFDDD